MLLHNKLRHAFSMFVVLGVLGGCGAGSGVGLDQNGQPIVSGTSGTDSAGAAAISLGPTLASIQANVFTPNCAQSGCHGNAPQQGLRLDSVANSTASLVNIASPRDSNLVRVRPSLPNASFLIQKLEGTQTLGDRMPQGGPFLPQSTIDVVRLWIVNGAKE